MEEPEQPLVPFTPVPVRHRNDGLERSAQPVRGTGEHYSEKQYAFIEALAENDRASLAGGKAAQGMSSGIVGAACLGDRRAPRLPPRAHARVGPWTL